jgi:hypothetical protein
MKIKTPLGVFIFAGLDLNKEILTTLLFIDSFAPQPFGWSFN